MWPDQHRDLARRLAELDRAGQDPGAPALGAVVRALDGAPVAVEQLSDRLVLTFPVGLFDGSVRFAGDARARLREVGTRLGAAGTTVRFVVVGHTADVTGTTGGEDDRGIGLRRAEAAAHELAEAGSRPLSDFPTTTTDGRPVRPGDDPAVNRTVSVVVQQA
ncbi:hypothetical protein [Pseudonocardia humida]|uniref:OmpA family protein n=1 Tax=Pseudonocardia humida TaxID=2800819 RepID=A0ABT1A655_9PSEU|nr:hypothetical protein [Pseudonocardia humida]MCO1658492.1 hypothetical protein [Pseudonocardia humida]